MWELIEMFNSKITVNFVTKKCYYVTIFCKKNNIISLLLKESKV